MDKKRAILISLLCLAVLACLTPTAAAVVATTQESIDAEPRNEWPMDEPTRGEWTTATQPVQRCAVVTAVEALHLRLEPTEHSRTLAFLAGGEVVHLVSDRDPDWWLVSRAGVIGYARSKFLELTACP